MELKTFYFCKFIKKNWKKIETIFEKNFSRNTWNIRYLVDESFVPANKGTSVLYCRLSDFWEERQNIFWNELFFWKLDKKKVCF